jgi:hypothetical protein
LGQQRFDFHGFDRHCEGELDSANVSRVIQILLGRRARIGSFSA